MPSVCSGRPRCRFAVLNRVRARPASDPIAQHNCFVAGVESLARKLAEALLQMGGLSAWVWPTDYRAAGALEITTGQLRVYLRPNHKQVAEKWAEQFNGSVLIVATGS